jgi:hypothetical protein
VADFPKGTRVQVKGLKSTPQHNGKIGTVSDTSKDGNRLIVDLDGQGVAQPLSLKPANLGRMSTELEADYPKGTRVQVKGLKSTPQHNGKLGTVSDTSKDGNRLIVDLDGQGVAQPLSLKPANLGRMSTELEAKARVQVQYQ